MVKWISGSRARPGMTEKQKPGRAGLLTISISISSLRELGDRVRQARHLPARIVLVNDVALRGLHQFRFRVLHRLERRLAMMVRRAILRVAFLAEVVLAMFSTILRLSSLGWSGLSAPAVQIA